ncbi:erythrocyte membrane protein 1, PfEMP1, putative [Plasmodium reichenowi]|uniref:Erythrocyte membrane protein 1, PfEMP1, putative n=1 Tax=Plasmodium reichenowi TaxID=5854 RepID=A0A2P9DST5_PLARE|nr:erythrocyte membrane protein 1, PfEMP1, putative [Plasmodium reichenowi]
MQIPKSDYDIPTLKSSNRYIPYGTGKYRGKRYVYIEGDSGTDSGYTDHYSDITSSSESEYEEFDINDIYVPHAPKYKTLIEVVLEPSKRDTFNTPSADTPSNKFTDEEWNKLKQHFISGILENAQKDLPKNNISANTPMNTQPNTLYFDNHEEKPFIMSIHDRNLLSGEEYNYDMINNSGIYPSSSNRHSLSGTKDPISDNRGPYSGTKNPYSGTKDPYSGTKVPYSGVDSTSDENNLYSGIDTINGNNDLYSGSGLIGDNCDSYSGIKNPISDNRDSYSGKNDVYSGIDLINDALSGGNQTIDIYDELLKRKENELFGTEHPKRTSNNSVAKNTNSDPITNQLQLFHKWLDRHRDMCEQWDKNNKKEELLDELKEEWDKDNKKNNGENNINKMLNTDVSIQIHIDNKPFDDNIYLDTYPDKYTVGNINPNLVGNQNPNITLPSNPNLVETPTNNPNHVQIEMSVKNTQLVEENYPIGDVWGI